MACLLCKSPVRAAKAHQTSQIGLWSAAETVRRGKKIMTSVEKLERMQKMLFTNRLLGRSILLVKPR